MLLPVMVDRIDHDVTLQAPQSRGIFDRFLQRVSLADALDQLLEQAIKISALRDFCDLSADGEMRIKPTNEAFNIGRRCSAFFTKASRL